MDPVRQPAGQTNQYDSDGDLNKLLYKFGQSVKQGILLFYRAFVGIGKLFLLAILFLLRNIIWLGVGTALGLGYGVYLLTKNGAKFESQMIVKANFQSSRSLYNTVDYLNAMMGSGRRSEFAQIFNLSPAEASSVQGFYIEPVESEIIKAQIYKDLFIERRSHNPEIKSDTLWQRTVSYKDFKDALTDYDYPFYRITVVATNPGIFSKFADGIVRQVSEIPLLKEASKKHAALNTYDEALIKNAINGIDSLRLAYNQRLMHVPDAPGSDQLAILGNAPAPTVPELDLYDKLLDLRDELRKSANRSVTEQNVIEIYSPFSAIGQRVSFFKQSVTRFGLLGLVLSVIILLAVALYKLLAALEKKRKLA
jgi:hypothetical protein